MVEHFRRVQKNTKAVEIILSFEEGFASGTRAEGADRFSRVMGYAVVEGGKFGNYIQ